MALNSSAAYDFSNYRLHPIHVGIYSTMHHIEEIESFFKLSTKKVGTLWSRCRFRYLSSIHFSQISCILEVRQINHHTEVTETQTETPPYVLFDELIHPDRYLAMDSACRLHPSNLRQIHPYIRDVQYPYPHVSRTVSIKPCIDPGIKRLKRFRQIASIPFVSSTSIESMSWIYDPLRIPPSPRYLR